MSAVTTDISSTIRESYAKKALIGSIVGYAMDGFDLLSLMRSDERTASIPVILLSCLSDHDTTARAVAFGAADVLTKPVALVDLMKSIHACVARGDRGQLANCGPA